MKMRVIMTAKNTRVRVIHRAQSKSKYRNSQADIKYITCNLT